MCRRLRGHRLSYAATNWPRWDHHFLPWDPTLAEQLLRQRQPTPFRPDWLLQGLVTLQFSFGQVSAAAQLWLANHCGVAITDVRALMSFYHFLRESEPPRYQLYFANNIVEQQNGLEPILNRLRSKLASADCRLETTSCIGQSDRPLSALVNGLPVVGINQDNLDELCQLLNSGVPVGRWPEHWFPPADDLRHAGPMTRYDYHPGMALRHCQKLSSEAIIGLISQAGLRGLGGAGFPTALKWLGCQHQPAATRYLICNADEGEPGTFKDRYYLRQQTDPVIEGMLIAARAIGASQGFIYLRAEYLYLYHHLQQRLEEWRRQGYLGRDFDIEVQVGAGAYICGEESALINSLAGQRGIPRPKPPFPGERGLFDKPTVVNNVETFAAVTCIIQQGPAAFREQGSDTSPGTRVHSVSGDCPRPGLYELAQGTPLRRLLQLCGGEQAGCVQVGGPSGALLFPEQFDSTLDFDSPGRGGEIMVFDQTRSVADIAGNFTRFFRYESCGFCTPCRAGTVALEHLLKRLQQQPERRLQAMEDIMELSELMAETSHCGLGKTAALPARNLISRWVAHD